MVHDPKIQFFSSSILEFYKSKKAPKRQKVCIFCAIEIYGVSRWIGNQILPHFGVLQFEIGPLEAEKVACSNLD